MPFDGIFFLRAVLTLTSELSHVQRLPESGGTNEASLKVKPGMASLTAMPSLSRVSSRMLASWAPSLDAWARSWDSWNTSRPAKLPAKQVAVAGRVSRGA